jgi:hypothetical protein
VLTRQNAQAAAIKSHLKKKKRRAALSWITMQMNPKDYISNQQWVPDSKHVAERPLNAQNSLKKVRKMRS